MTDPTDIGGMDEDLALAGERALRVLCPPMSRRLMFSASLALFAGHKSARAETAQAVIDAPIDVGDHRVTISGVLNTRDKNFTVTKLKKRMEQVAEHIAGYLQALDTADRQEGEAAAARSGRLVEKIDRLRAQMAMLKTMQGEVEAAPDSQVSLTDPDARSMATSGRGSGIVGYNVQSAVEGEHHLIVAHDVVMTGHDRDQLACMAAKARDAMGVEALDVLADRGYFSGEEILACEPLGMTPYLPRPLTSGAKAAGRFGKQDFVYLPDPDVYRCPAGALLPHHMTTIERGLKITTTGTGPVAPVATSSLNARPALSDGSPAGNMKP